MRVLILNTDYEAFLADIYAQIPDLAQASYAEQMAARNESLFGSANFYSEGLRANGAEAADLHLNNKNMQLRWAAEHGLTVPETETIEPNAVATRLRRLLGLKKKPVPELAAMPVWMRTVMIAQIEHFRPDVILNQAMHLVSARALRSLTGKQCLLAGQIAAPWHEPDDDRNYDLIVTSLPNFLQRFERRGVRAFYNQLGFAPNVLDQVPTAERTLGVTFVGTLSSFHAERIRLLEYLATRTKFNIWGMIADEIPAASPIHACYRGQAWGKEMFSIFRRSQIVINQHIGIAGEFANNMRLYEATGCGAALVTDRKTNLQDLFEVGSEVVDYGDAAECLARVEELLDDPDRCAEISRKGQERTCTSHTYLQRTAEMQTKFADLLQ